MGFLLTSAGREPTWGPTTTRAFGGTDISVPSHRVNGSRGKVFKLNLEGGLKRGNIIHGAAASGSTDLVMFI